jgi:2-C-methyl-D-erythritol 2,4-cyclodiphosphate synthase
MGYDIHAFSTDAARPLWLGGVEFEGEGPGLDGHSDADPVLHAVVDAILGAAGLGDIGEHFPNTDPRWKGEPSSTFLLESAKLSSSQGWNVVNIDVSVLAERPRLSPRRDEVCSVIAGLLGISRERVSVKATTNEGLGSIGRGEGVAAFAVATLRREI